MKQQEDSTSNLRFPAGMHVLVVDDDATCLKLMDHLLRKCQYLVTTTTRAKDALKFLKDSRRRFDIVISDVEMPDMDGIKLLQLVGLEMNIPVIMLSAYSDTKRVMQGIRNGACDYLVKPVRIQELQNIWQHVVRRNKSITLRKPPPSAVEEVERGHVQNIVKTERLDSKSSEQSSSGRGDDDNDEQEDSGQENEETTTQKKPRLFWSVELHQKFVDAVDSLGIEKAFPKKILDLMNVEGLTREKVASHLQKYRLYLRKVENESNQPASKISAYEDGHIGPLGGGYGVSRSLAGASGRFPGINPSLRHPTIFGRLNSAAGLSIRSLSSSPMLKTAQLPSSSTSFPSFGKFELATPSPNTSVSMFQGLPSLQQSRASFLLPPRNSVLPKQSISEFGNQSSATVPSSNIRALEGVGGSGSNLMDPNKCTSNWESSGHSSIYPQASQPNPFTPISGDSIALMPPHMQNVQNDPLDYLCGLSSVDSLEGNMQNQECLNDSVISSCNPLGHSHIWQDNRPDHILGSCNMTGASSSLNSIVAPVEHTLNQNTTNLSTSPFSQLEGASSQILQQNVVQHPNAETNAKFNDFLLDEAKPTGGSGNGCSEYLEDIVGRFLKQDNGETTQTGDDFELDSFSI
ncbi:hypothetical protein vseg_000005 [Gypsophila vaccaria]